MIRANLLSAFALSALATLLVTASGCSICGTCFDYEYSAYGGATPRGDRIHGRVNSLFAPAEGGVYAGGEMIVPSGEIEYLPSQVDPMVPEPPMNVPMNVPMADPGMGTRSNLVPQRVAAVPIPATPLPGGRTVALPSGERVTLAPGEVLETELTVPQRSLLVK